MPFFIKGQETLSLKNILNIHDKDSFLKEVIENGYSEGNSTNDKIYYGKGMSKDDLEMCYLKHSTSKITNQEDLFRLKTKVASLATWPRVLKTA